MKQGGGLMHARHCGERIREEYQSPRYSDEMANAIREFTTSPAWDDWDLDGLLAEVPTKYANRLGVKYGIFCSTGTAGLHASLMA